MSRLIALTLAALTLTLGLAPVPAAAEEAPVADTTGLAAQYPQEPFPAFTGPQPTAVDGEIFGTGKYFRVEAVCVEDRTGFTGSRVLEAVLNWRAAGFNYYYRGPDGCDTVYWNQKVMMYWFADYTRDYCAITDVRANRDGYVTSAAIYMNLTSVFQADGRCWSSNSHTRSTVHHELGHALGLDHEFTNQSVMWHRFEYPARTETPNTRDAARVNYLY